MRLHQLLHPRPHPHPNTTPQDLEIQEITLSLEISALILTHSSTEKEDVELLLRKNGLWVCKIWRCTGLKIDRLLGLPNRRIFFVFWLSFPTHPSCKQVLRQAGPRLRVSQKRKNGKREADPDSPEREGKDVCFPNECPGSQPPFPVQNPGNGLKYWKIFFFFKGNWWKIRGWGKKRAERGFRMTLWIRWRILENREGKGEAFEEC